MRHLLFKQTPELEGVVWYEKYHAFLIRMAMQYIDVPDLAKNL